MDMSAWIILSFSLTVQSKFTKNLLNYIFYFESLQNVLLYQYIPQNNSFKKIIKSQILHAYLWQLQLFIGVVGLTKF